MLAYFLECDYVSLGPELRLNNSKTKKSYLGAILSVFIALLVLALTVYLGKDIFLRESPNLLTIEENLSSPIYYYFNATNYIFGWKLTDPFIGLIPDVDSYFDILVTNEIFDSIGGKATEHLYNNVYDGTRCSAFSKYYIDIPPRQLNSFFCPANFNTTTLVMGGSFSSDYLGRIYAEVKPCTNDVDKNKKCKSKEERDKLLSNGVYFVALYRDYLMNSKNATNPIGHYQLPLIVPISNVFTKDITFNYRNLLVKTDIGFLLQDLREDISLKYDSMSVEYVDNSKGNLPFLTMRVQISNERLTYERKYLKVQELAASVGGMAKFLMIVATILCYRLNNKQINLTIMNELFDFVHGEGNDDQGANSINDIFGEKKSKIFLKKSKRRNSGIEVNPSMVSEAHISKFKISGKEETGGNRVETLGNLKLLDSKVAQNEKIFKNFDGDNAPRNDVKENNKTILKLNLTGRRKNSKLNYSFCQDILAIFCVCSKFQTSSLRNKDAQYFKCIDEVRENMNLNFMVRKLNEIDFIKAILFNKEQILSFNYFHKPLVDLRKNKIDDCNLISDIHQTQKLSEDKHLDMLNNYFEEVSNGREIKIEDKKIMGLLDIEFN